MRVLVCGSRDWNDEDAIDRVLRGYYRRTLVVIEGGASGADTIAYVWAKTHNVAYEHFPADWKKYGNAAGPIRNQQMLAEGKPDVVWAFKDGFDFQWVYDKVHGHDPDYSAGGTEDMVFRAKAKGIPCYVVSRA